MEGNVNDSGKEIKDFNDEFYDNLNFEVLNQIDYEALNVKLQEKVETDQAKAKEENIKKVNMSLSILSLVIGILSIIFNLLLCCNVLIVFPAAFFAVAGLVLGIISLKKGENRGLSIAGIVCSSAGVFISIGIFILIIVLNIISIINEHTVVLCKI